MLNLSKHLGRFGKLSMTKKSILTSELSVCLRGKNYFCLTLKRLL